MTTNETKRKRGRPPGKQPIVMRTVRFDTDLDTMMQGMADHTGIPYGRIVNAIVRAYADAQNISIGLGATPGDTYEITVPITWPTMKGDNDAR